MGWIIPGGEVDPHCVVMKACCTTQLHHYWVNAVSSPLVSRLCITPLLGMPTVRSEPCCTFPTPCQPPPSRLEATLPGIEWDLPLILPLNDSPTRSHLQNEGVVAWCTHSAAPSDVSGDFTRRRGPLQTTMAGVPKCLWMVARGFWMIPGFSFCLAGGFLLLPGGFSQLLG